MPAESRPERALTANTLRLSRSVSQSADVPFSLRPQLASIHQEDVLSRRVCPVRPAPDQVIQDIADYVLISKIDSKLAYDTARLCLIDTIGCGLGGSEVSPSARNYLGPVVEGTKVPNGTSSLLF